MADKTKMIFLSSSKVNLSRQLNRRRWKRRFVFALSGLILVVLSKMVWNVAVVLPAHAEQPIDAILVLGGSIRREIYASELAKSYPHLPIIISRGSDAPCIFQIFQIKQAPIENILLENCADSTFGNFFFNVPLLRQKKVQKVKVVTSPTHLPRAQYLAYIHLGAQGIAVEMDITAERGRPGNHESPSKTALDVTRSVIWSFFAQTLSPPCTDAIPLKEINWEKWQKRGYRCERQKYLKL